MKQLLERIEKRLTALEQQFRERFASHRSTSRRASQHHSTDPGVLDRSPEHDDVIGVEAAMALTGLSKSGIYHKTCSRNGEPPELAHYKRGKRVYFSRAELTAWMTSTRVKDRAEIEADAADYMAVAYGDAAHGNERVPSRSSARPSGRARSSSRSSAGSSVRQPGRAHDQVPAQTTGAPTRSNRTSQAQTNQRRTSR